MILTMGTALVAIVLLLLMAFYLTNKVVQNESDERLTALTEAAAELVAAPLAAADGEAIEHILATVVRDEGLAYAYVLAPDGATIAHQHSEKLEEDELSSDDKEYALGALRASQAAIAEQQRTLETRVNERTADLQQALAELQESASAREQLSATVRELASPIVPVLDDILVMPLIGVTHSAQPC